MAAKRAVGRACRRVAVLVLAFLMASTALSALPAATALAYENLTAHPEINKYAVERFEQRAREDEWLALTTLKGLPVEGMAVTEIGLLQIREETVTKALSEWIAHGGMSADEPELPASFRHFFDPLRNAGATHLTDHIDDLLDFGFGLGSLAVQGAGYIIPLVDTENPKVDARIWALSHYDNRYSYEMAAEYYRAALAKLVTIEEDGLPRLILEYGQAWRAVGETMHLVADMTMPAHVRNDSHPFLDVSVPLPPLLPGQPPSYTLRIGNPDPCESTTSGADVKANANGKPSPSIDYDATDLFDLFEAVALWTSENFYSEDTIQINRFFGLAGPTENGNPEYPSPQVPTAATRKGNYYYRDIDGQDVPILGTSLLRRCGLIHTNLAIPYGTLDWTVLQAQRRLLIPTAIEASSRVIDNFLPRFKAEFTVEQVAAGKYWVSGNLLHRPTLVWPAAPEINNGAFLEVAPKGSNQSKPIWLGAVAYRSGNRIETELEAEAGSVVSLRWDLGGYVITSEPVVLGGMDITVLPERLGEVFDGDKISLEAVMTKIPASLKGIKIEWSFGDDKREAATLLVTAPAIRHEVTHTYDKPGEHQLTVRVLNPKNGLVIAETTRTVVVQPQKITVQIYPRRITGKPGVAVEASSLPQDSKYRYEWVFGDGQTLGAGESVVQHTYDKLGTYDLILRLYQVGTPGAPGTATPLAEDTVKVEIVAGDVCDLCGYVHGPLTKETLKGAIRYKDAQGQRQCLYTGFYDEGNTKLRDTVVYVNGKAEGVHTWYYETGEMQQENHYVAGVANGLHRYYTKTGAVSHEYEYRNGNRDGKATEWWTGWAQELSPDKTHKWREGTLLYIAELGSVRHGFWTEWWENTGALKSEGSYAQGKKEGPWREYWTDGLIKEEGSYLNDLRTGHWIHWGYQSGKPERWEGPYVEGKRHGTWVEPIGAGEYWKGDYVSGAKKGVWTWYRADGSVVTTKTY